MCIKYLLQLLENVVVCELSIHTHNNNLHYFMTTLTGIHHIHTKHAYLCCNCIFRFGYITNRTLLFRMSVAMSSCYNNPSQCSSSSSSVAEKIDLLICNKCIWLASIYANRNIHSNIKCPICNDNSNLESMPIFQNESKIIDMIL